MTIDQKRYLSKAQIITARGDQPSEANVEIQKVNQKHLSKLMRDILNHIDIDHGIDRGQLIAVLYGLERRYCGWSVEPCMRPKQLRAYTRLYLKKQPTLTRALNRLENKGLVRLIRKAKYVKVIELTPKGKIIVECLAQVHRSSKNIILGEANETARMI